MDWRGCEIIIFGDAEFLQTRGNMGVQGQDVWGRGCKLMGAGNMGAGGSRDVGQGNTGRCEGRGQEMGEGETGRLGNQGQKRRRQSDTRDMWSHPWQAVLLPGMCFL